MAAKKQSKSVTGVISASLTFVLFFTTCIDPACAVNERATHHVEVGDLILSLPDQPNFILLGSPQAGEDRKQSHEGAPPRYDSVSITSMRAQRWLDPDRPNGEYTFDQLTIEIKTAEPPTVDSWCANADPGQLSGRIYSVQNALRTEGGMNVFAARLNSANNSMLIPVEDIKILNSPVILHEDDIPLLSAPMFFSVIAITENTQLNIMFMEKALGGRRIPEFLTEIDSAMRRLLVGTPSLNGLLYHKSDRACPAN